MAASLEGYERERNAMIADIAHELRTPLATLQMRLDALRDGLVPFDQGEAELLLQHAALLSRLVEDLKVLSLADSGRLTLRFQEVELGSWLESVTEVLRDAARRGGSSLEVSVPAEAIPVRADVDRLFQVARNLVDNAAEAMAGGGEVAITLRREGEEAVLAVRDRGPGIDPADLDSIFERFAQGGRRDARTGVGRGLGLAIVRSLVKLHGGTVTATNRDVGAEITVRLPT
jgi:signal transduction histidine kinase